MQLTLSQVAELFSVDERTVTRWVNDEHLPAHEVNLQYLFQRPELLEWAVTHHHSFSPRMFQRLGRDRGASTCLADALQLGGLGPQVGGQDRYEVFREAIAGLRLPGPFDRDELLDLLMAREKSSGTAIGHGIAIPHPRYPVVLPGGSSALRVCYLQNPLDFQASDGQPVGTLFLMICPTVHEHLQLLARLALVLKSADFRRLLALYPDKAQRVSAVKVEELKFAEGTELQQA